MELPRRYLWGDSNFNFFAKDIYICEFRVKQGHFDFIFKKNAGTCVFTVDVLCTQYIQSLMNINLVWTVTFHPLQMFFIPGTAFSMPTKLCDSYFEYLFVALFHLLSFQRKLVSLYCFATIDTIMYWNLLFAEGKKWSIWLLTGNKIPSFSSQILLLVLFVWNAC